MSDQSTDTIEQVDEAPDNGASVVQETPPADASADAAPWAAEHPEWQAADAWKAYNELRTRFSRGEHNQPEQPAEEEVVDPFASLPPEDDERTVRQLAAYYQSTGPRAALEWIDSNPGYVSAQTRNEFVKAWNQDDPGAVAQYAAERLWSERETQLRQEFQQQNAPYQARVQYGVNETALAQAAEKIPEWDTWGPRVMDFLVANPHWIADVQHDPNLMVQRMGQAYAMLAWEQAGTQPPPAAQPTPAANGKPPRTTTRNAAPPGGDDDRVQRELQNLSRLRGK